MNLITGYKGYKHVKSEDIAAFNRCVFGSGAYVLNTGKCFTAELADTNVLRIYDGELLICGYHARTEPGSYDDVALTPGTSGTYRHDYIVAQYEKKADGTEEVSFLDVCGTGASTADAAALPSLVQNDLPNYGTVYQMPLYTVLFSGLSAGDPVPVFTPIENLPAQIQKKQDTITGGASTVAKSNLTSNRALISNASGKIVVSGVTATELGYIAGLTAKVQTQLDGIKAVLNGIGRHYFKSSSANLASKWEWSIKKFDTYTSIDDSAGNLTSKVTNGYWIPPKSGFVIVEFAVSFASNSNGSRGVQLSFVNSSNELTGEIATVRVRAATHAQTITAVGVGYISDTQKLALRVAQDSGSTLAVSAYGNVLFIPNY